MNVIGLVLALTLVLVAVGIVLILKLSRAREVQFAAEEIAKLAWPQVPADDAAWRAFVELASTGSTGAARKIDNVLEETQESVAGQGYRDPAARHPRFLAIGIRTLRSKTLHERHHSETPELWIGEARAIPVDKPWTAFDIIGDMVRASALKTDPAEMAVLRPQLTGPLADSVRAVIKSKPRIVQNLAPLVHVGPHAWVMVSPVARGGRHVGLLVETANELSKVFDG
jgi:hypothetical protein